MVSPLTLVAQAPVLIHSFTNPAPAAGDYFGTRMTVLGNERVRVGAPHDAPTATNIGAVYLFHTNGTLLTTFTNPYLLGSFGGAITTLGSDRVLISSPQHHDVYPAARRGRGIAHHPARTV